MLTSSPVAPRPTSASASASASASPRELRYAPISRSPSTRSAHQSPNIAASLRRRHSKPSVSQSSPQPPPSGPAKPPPYPEPKQYVGVDAATQYSPMEPFDPTVPLRAADAPAPRKSTSVVKEPEAPAESNGEYTQRDKSVSQPLSPAKRRNSQVHGLVSAVEAPLRSPPKRTRPNVPVKTLPTRYEKCEVEDMVILIANMIGELIETNDSLGMKSGNLTRFHSRYHDHDLSSSPFTSKSQWLTRLPAEQRQASLCWIIFSDLPSTPH
jgi:hypothetical protein